MDIETMKDNRRKKVVSPQVRREQVEWVANAAIRLDVHAG